MSQLNRGAEQRTDKKPMLSDLRESGCLPASTRVLRADTGAEVTLGELFRSGARDVPVWSLDDSLRYVRRDLTHVFSTGVKQLFRMRLASGKTVRATANHPFLTYDGWRALGDLRPGARVAVPRHIPAPQRETAWSDDRIALTAWQLVCGRVLPAEVFALPKRHLRDLLRTTLAATRVGEDRVFALKSRECAHDVSQLLLRFGIRCTISDAVLAVTEQADQVRLAGQIESGLFGNAAREAVLAALPTGLAPAALHGRMTEVLQDPSLTRVVQVLDEQDLQLEATNDVFWDSVVGIEPDGVEEVFDATVVGTHNFVADGIAVHNSIEQDADMVVLLHREDAYEKESPRAGEADFIVAKHRNGPTATITVAFQGHYSRFVDMSSS
jgi:replicative DNA helicase